MSSASSSRHLTAAPAELPPARPADPGRPSRSGLGRLAVGAGLAVAVLILGVIAKIGPVARLDLRVDQHIAARHRTAELTSLAKAASQVATPETVGLALLIGLPLVLLLARRRLDAV